MATEAIGSLRMWNSHGKLRKVFLCTPDYFEELPISEVAIRSLDSGDKVDRALSKKMHGGAGQRSAQR